MEIENLATFSQEIEGYNYYSKFTNVIDIDEAVLRETFTRDFPEGEWGMLLYTDTMMSESFDNNCLHMFSSNNTVYTFDKNLGKWNRYVSDHDPIALACFGLCHINYKLLQQTFESQFQLQFANEINFNRTYGKGINKLQILGKGGEYEFDYLTQQWTFNTFEELRNELFLKSQTNKK